LFQAEWIHGRLIVTQTGGQDGMHPGDAILKADGKPVHAFYEEMASLTSAATPQSIRYLATYELLGRIALRPSEIEIEPYAARGTRQTVKLTRKDWKPAAPRREMISEIKPGVMYVDLTRITNQDWAAALPKLERSSGIVFDLRGYPHLSARWMTYLNEKPMTSQQWHVPVVTRPNRVDMKFDQSGRWDMQPSKPYLKAKRAILTDGSAISYAESTMGIIEHYKLAEIVGSTTAGTNGNANTFWLPGGYAVNFTGMKVLKHDGSQHHGIGIRPTIPVERSRAGVAAGRDEVLERALSLF
jgi:C-terminal processing protease CtpA/Prc